MTRNPARYDRLRQIERMDVEEKYTHIWWLDMGYEFTWDFGVAGAIATASSVAPPHMAALLVRTGEITENTQRRMEHFGLLAIQMVRYGFKDPRGLAAVRQMNRIHANAVRHISDEHQQWSISNDEFLFVLATGMIIPIRWLDRYAWRKPSRQERVAAYLHNREQGRLMGIKNIPDSYEGLVRFHDAYVEKHFTYSPEAARLWQALEPTVIEPLVGGLPARLRPLGRRLAKAAMPALITPAMRKAFGVREPSRLRQLLVDTAFRIRAARERGRPPVLESPIPDPMPSPSFPQADYRVEDLGPAHTTAARSAPDPAA
ncbi:oxygenase MpaB family protein [Streptomyces sp. LHD-70]|uniref:oxygenase MpaB family protein n=1 Tax=Streptomyces sp. LHD-70 TaxID=3072140 RepID=UPI00280D98B0|nr:oxygenase MpaB family protein [Streptomyces sp. LHD-70]MDQ8706190.1 oxygenase MpaB family protein [Streptomyces sp. LHD-70]